MGEMIQKKFREMLDSVSNASDEFVNKYFSNDSVDLDIDVSDDTEEITEDDVETIKGETDDWFDYKGNVVNNNDLETTKEELKDTQVDDELKVEEVSNEEIESKQEDNSDPLDVNSNDEIESTLKENVDTSDIEKDIVSSSIDDLNLNYDYDSLKNEIADEKPIQIEEKIETVEDTQYKKLSGDELIDLLNNTDNGEDFFKEIEV